MFFFNRYLQQYIVTLEVNGRHPYLVSHELDYFEGKKDVQVTSDCNFLEKSRSSSS